MTGVRVHTHPFKAGDLHGLHRGRVHQDRWPQFKHVSDELVTLETHASKAKGDAGLQRVAVQIQGEASPAGGSSSQSPQTP